MGRRDADIGLCPFECKKVKATREVIRTLKDERQSLRQEKRSLLEYSDRLESLRQLSADGNQILGVGSHLGLDYVVVMSPVAIDQWNENREVFLYRLPVTNRWRQVCHLSMMYHGSCFVEIIDWNCTEPNKGYGSILMTHLLNFLRASGVRHVYGSINYTDFKNEAKLRHFYTKFGFQITDYKMSRSIHLNLFNEQIFHLRHDGHTVCVRSNTYSFLRSEKILEEDRKKSSTTE